MTALTREGDQIVAELAARHGVRPEAVRALALALAVGGGTQAQFTHPDLGGMGQWSQGGMLMIGDMFNHGLKAKVDALCSELAGVMRTVPLFAAPASGAGGTEGAWWPAELGSPGTSGGQNALRYAYFPAVDRLAVERDGLVTVHDTLGHRISGVAQAQGRDQTLTFSTPEGTISAAELPVIQGLPQPGRDPAATPSRPARQDGVLATIERLGELRDKQLITEQEFAAKKAELLARL